MDRSFMIDFDWLDRSSTVPIERYTFADLSIAVGNSIATELHDMPAKTTRPTMRGSAYDMAVWLLQNWWRLNYEPERDTFDWRMSHCLGAAGNGFLWPDVWFISDGVEVTLVSRATEPSSSQMVRYLNSFHETVSLAEFRSTILTFADAVIERLRETGTGESLLHDLREDIRVEEAEPESRHWRQVEALLGYDPDEATEKLVNEVLSASRKYGQESVNEVIAEFSGKKASSILNWLKRTDRSLGASVTVPDAESLRQKTASIDISILPWQRAEEAAKFARAQWSIPEKPVSNRQLKELFSLKNGLLTDSADKAPMNIGFRNEDDNNNLKATLTSHYEANRRYGLLKIVAGHLFSPENDHLLPVTNAKTARQKFQRAFAQEFLCPSQALVQFLENDFSDERIEDAASYFNVSPLLVKMTLTNKGLFGRYEIEDQWVR
jgi:hypothetical protein